MASCYFLYSSHSFIISVLGSVISLNFLRRFLPAAAYIDADRSLCPALVQKFGRLFTFHFLLHASETHGRCYANIIGSNLRCVR